MGVRRRFRRPGPLTKVSGRLGSLDLRELRFRGLQLGVFDGGEDEDEEEDKLASASTYLSILQKERHDHTVNYEKHHLCGTTNMLMLNLEDFLCCSISGHAQYLMHLSMWFKVAYQLRFDLLV